MSGTEAIHLIVKSGECNAQRGAPGKGISARRPQGVEGIKAGIGTSVIREAVTDAYRASTLRVPHG